jgi:NAD(P)H-hydrate repair Nnr-like enzyme with NAD(P)H-hydrate dehydratase domain
MLNYKLKKSDCASDYLSDIDTIVCAINERMHEIIEDLRINPRRTAILYGSDKGKLREGLAMKLRDLLASSLSFVDIVSIDLDKLTSPLILGKYDLIIELIQCMEEGFESARRYEKLLVGLNDNVTISIDFPCGIETLYGAIDTFRDWKITASLLLIKDRVLELLEHVRERSGKLFYIEPSLPNKQIESRRDEIISSETQLGVQQLVCYEKRDLLFDSRATIIGNANKYSRGVVALVTGSERYIGAALLSTRAALHGGAGTVFYYGSSSKYVVERNPSIIASNSIVNKAIRADVGLVGSGIYNAYSLSEIISAFRDVPIVVIDADSLNELNDSKNKEILKLIEMYKQTILIVPNIYEASKLLDHSDTTEVRYNPLAAALELNKKFGFYTLIRDRNMILAYNNTLYLLDEREFCNKKSSSTAGTGDVYAGLVASVLANKNEADFIKNIIKAIFLHRNACELAVEKYKSPFITSQDLLDQLPYSWQTLSS